MPRVVLLLTATIDPGDTPFVAHRNSNARREEYATALEWYSGVVGLDAILFCENSEAPLGRIADVAGRGAIRIIRCVAARHAASRGKGYGELQMIRDALQQARLVDPATFVIKVTGRYVVKNLHRLVAALKLDPSWDVVTDFRRGLTQADVRVCAFRPDFVHRFLVDQLEMIDDSKGVYLEHVFGRAVHLAIAEGVTWRPWPLEPDISGVSGTDGHAYRRDRFRRVGRAMIRRVQWLLLQR